MNVLFIHNNFPAQFKHLARHLAQQPNVRVAAIGAGNAHPVRNVKLIKYALTEVDVSTSHPFARRFNVECHRAEQVLYGLSTLASSGFVPDVVMVHPGWGEALPLRTVFPRARLLVYCEFFYGNTDRDVGFDPEFAALGMDGNVALQLKNAATVLALSDCDGGISPTSWQRSTFPAVFQDKITVLHDGIDTDVAKPAPNAEFRLSSGRRFTPADEIVTFAARNLEPLRGYHIFMRALPKILAERPKAEVLIIGGDGTSYGALPPANKTWQAIFLEEVASQIDRRRVHFTGHLPYQSYLRALQISSAHVYLTYPFVLSWSLLEAMSAGCLVIASDTMPVRDVVSDDNGIFIASDTMPVRDVMSDDNGILIPFFDVKRLSETVVNVLKNPQHFRKTRTAARQTVLDRYDLTRRCLPELSNFTLKNQAPLLRFKIRRPAEAESRNTLTQHDA
jgi:glycosyltransferase involved in cell wall biosynthesis